MVYPKLSRNNTNWYLKIRKDILNGCLTRQTLKSFKNIQNKRDILLHRYQENDFSLFFKACIMNLTHVINFSFQECDIDPRYTRQSMVEMEEQLYECKVCNMIQCNIDKKEKETFPPLMFVIWFMKDKTIVENFLLNFDYSSSSSSSSFPLGITPLQLACSENNFEIVKLLIDNNGAADVTKMDNMNKSSLMYTLLGGRNGGWKMCLLYHQKCNNKEEEEEEDDDEVIKHKICEILLKHGANTVINEKEKSTGFNAIDIARKLGYLSIVKLFEEAYIKRNNCERILSQSD